MNVVFLKPVPISGVWTTPAGWLGYDGTNRQTNKQTNKQTPKQTNKQTNKQNIVYELSTHQFYKKKNYSFFYVY